MTPAIRLLFVGLAALGAGVLGYYIYDRTAHRDPAAALAVAMPRTSPAEAASGVVSPAPGGPIVPETRPTFTLKDVDGKPRSITEWDGKSLMVNFWATWCAPCRREIPLLNKLHAEYAAQNVEVVGIAVDFLDDVKAYMKATPLAYPVLVGEEDGLQAAEAFGVKTMAFPFTAFLDAKGRVLAVHMGELHEPQARAILAVVGRVNAGELPPPQARDEIRRALEALPPPAKDAATS